ncbi:MAG: zinc-ribbon domain-containing protein [Clostridiales bacterium]|nr:zinc-ribbon domain-containing protein [Clostridiales bacterium]
MRRKSLAEERPDLLAQWSPDNEFSPSDVSCGSHKKVLWICAKGHTWAATVKNRALIGSKCPYCEHRAVLKGYNDLQTLFPEIAKTWSPKNVKKPSEVSSRSNSDVFWLCENGHEWKSRVADRTEGHGCPYCAGQRVWKGFNDLATTHPTLIAEWSDKNIALSPESITYKNRSNVWWHCSKCGNDYQAVVYSRANGRICPFCIANGIKQAREQRLMDKQIAKDFNYFLPQLASIYYAGKHGIKVFLDSEDLVGFPLSAYIPDIGLAIDVCCAKKVITIKEYICMTKGITYINIQGKIPEEEVVSIVRNAFFDAHVYSHTTVEADLELLRKRFSYWKKKESNS